MTPQEAFDQSTRGIIKQGGPAIKWTLDTKKAERYPGCAYKTPDGLCCQIGQLIPPSKYNPEFDNSAEGPARVLRLVGFNLDDFHSNFVQDLQEVHDASAIKHGSSGTNEVRPMNEFWVEYRTRLLRFAFDYNLNTDVTNEIPIGQGQGVVT